MRLGAAIITLNVLNATEFVGVEQETADVKRVTHRGAPAAIVGLASNVLRQLFRCVTGERREYKVRRDSALDAASARDETRQTLAASREVDGASSAAAIAHRGIDDGIASGL